MNYCKAILLLGPTGAGKTPLGELIQEKGLCGRRCCHFDFGKQLRKIGSAKKAPKSFTHADIAFIRQILKDNLLLDDEHFYIAEKILRFFIKENDIGKEDLIILNGLPRHIGQSERVDSILKIELVVYLSCTAKVVYERIRNNIGGDRRGRIDDTMADIKNKMKIFRKKTTPLINHYRALRTRLNGRQFGQVLIKTIRVGIKTSAKDTIKI